MHNIFVSQTYFVKKKQLINFCLVYIINHFIFACIKEKEQLVFFFLDI